MSNIIAFTKGNKNTAGKTYAKPALPVGILKYGTSNSLPDNEEASVMIFTQDTGEIYIGNDEGKKLKRVSDVVVGKTANDFPVPGLSEKLYVSETEKAIFFWTGTEYQLLGGAGATISITPKVFVLNAQTEFPANGDEGALYIDKSTDTLHRFDKTSGKYVQVCKPVDVQQVLDRLQAVEQGVAKAAKQVDVDNMSKTLATAAANAADARAIASKADTNAASAAAAAEKALADNKAVNDHMLNDIAALKKADELLSQSKADKTDLDLYRKKADAIAEADLDANLVTLIKTNSGGTAYDDKAVKDRLTKLEADIVSKRDATDDVEELDLSPALAKKVNATTAVEARVKTLEDAGYATLVYTEATYVKKTDKISKDQLADAITNDLNKVPGMETLVNSLTSKIKELEANIAAIKANLPVKKIQILSVEKMKIDPAFYSAPYNTSFETVSTHLPKTATAKLSDGTSKEMTVTWKSNAYVPTKVGVQTIEGDIVTTDTVGNDGAFVAKCDVTVSEQQAATWEYRFSTSLGVQRVNLSDIHPGLTFTEEEFLGETETSPRAVKVYMIDNTTGTEVLKEVPARDDNNNLNGPSPDSTLRNGAVRFAPDANQNGGAIIFDKGSDYTVNYLIRKQPI